MKVKLSYKVRAGLYIFTGLGSPVMGYLLAAGIIGQLEMVLWMAEVSFVAGLAAFNVTPDAE